MNSIRITLLFLHIYNIFIIYNVINSKNNSLIHLLTIFFSSSLLLFVHYFIVFLSKI